MGVEIKLYQRPTDKDVTKQIIDIIKSLTGKWFTENVAEDTEKDILFQDVLCMSIDDKIVSFIIFTCLDGSINITLMGTKIQYHRTGIGTKLMNYFCGYIKDMSFDEIVLFTVPPRAKSAYNSTVNFYNKNGFKIVNEYTELWEDGAMKLVKKLE